MQQVGAGIVLLYLCTYARNCSFGTALVPMTMEFVTDELLWYSSFCYRLREETRMRR
jgi:hypothetical protein